MTTSTNVQTYKGGCHCGAVRFEAELDLSEGISRCNCTICTKLSQSGLQTKPSSFRIVKGAEHLSEYRVGASVNYRKFCKHCGVQLYGAGHVPELGGDFCSVNVNCLDDVELTELTYVYWDGRHDNWMAGARDKPWPVLSRDARPAQSA